MAESRLFAKAWDGKPLSDILREKINHYLLSLKPGQDEYVNAETIKQRLAEQPDKYCLWVVYDYTKTSSENPLAKCLMQGISEYYPGYSVTPFRDFLLKSLNISKDEISQHFNMKCKGNGQVPILMGFVSARITEEASERELIFRKLDLHERDEVEMKEMNGSTSRMTR